MTNPISISFVRHGLVHNPQRVLYGRLPRFRLSAEGQCQAQAAADHLQTRPFTTLFSSPMLRARQTANIILTAQPGLPLHTSGYLNESYVGYQGRPLAELKAQNLDLYTGFSAPYEQRSDVLSRARRFITKVRRHYPGQHIVAVTHGDPIVFLMLWTRNLPINPSGLRELGLLEAYPATASITTFTYRTQAAEEVPVWDYFKPY